MSLHSKFAAFCEKRITSKRKWTFDRGRSKLNQEAVAYLERVIATGTFENVLCIASRLNQLGNLYSVSGQIALADGDLMGWKALHRGWLYDSLAMKISIAEFQKGRVLGEFRPIKDLQTQTDRCSLLCAFAIATAQMSEMGFFGDALRVMVLDPSVVQTRHWKFHGVPPFIVQLQALERNQNVNLPIHSGEASGPYHEIILNWNNPDHLSDLIWTACEYHCQRIVDNSSNFISEFRDAPYDLLPAEILALYSIRRSLNLDVPNVEHALLNLVFAKPLGSPSEIEDPILSKLKDIIGL